MIPKIIHYCWFGGNELNDLAKKCIESWKKYCPDYEIIEWNESNYDYKKNPFMEAAYNDNKWAFVTDYARLDIVYNHGGIYLDTDVELIRSLDPLLTEKCFLGIEKGSGYIATGLGFGAEKFSEAVELMLNEYDGVVFESNDSKQPVNCPIYNTKPFYNYGFSLEKDKTLKTDIATIYSSEYFCPKNYYNFECDITEKTYSIHHFNASWHDDRTKKIYQLKKKLYSTFKQDDYRIANKLLSYGTKVINLEYMIKNEGVKVTMQNVYNRITGKQ